MQHFERATEMCVLSSPKLGEGTGGCRASLFPKGGQIAIETYVTLY